MAWREGSLRMQRHMGMVRKQRGETKDTPGQESLQEWQDRAEEMAYNLII